MPTDVSFIIAVRDEPAELFESTIAGVLQTSAAYRREIVVVDDASTVPVELEHPDVLIVRNHGSLGSARSRRLGASYANGKVLSFLDPHMTFAGDWLDRMLPHTESGALLCAAWWDYELTRPMCWGADYLWCGERDYNAGRCPGLNFRHRTKHPGEESAVEVPMPIGACYMQAREAYEKIGGFSPFFRTWGKLEQDLATRAWLAGLRVLCVPGAHVGHFSRSKFPYPVRWDDIEFNQLSTVRTAFDPATAASFETVLRPFSPQVSQWLAETDFTEWRALVEANRKISDREFFARFVPAALEPLGLAA
jgi:polypeptide N-acetylgalactosaminyltransferase